MLVWIEQLLLFVVPVINFSPLGGSNVILEVFMLYELTCLDSLLSRFDHTVYQHVLGLCGDWNGAGNKVLLVENIFTHFVLRPTNIIDIPKQNLVVNAA